MSLNHFVGKEKFKMTNPRVVTNFKQYQEGAEPRVLKYKGRNKKAITLEDSERILSVLKQIPRNVR